MSAEKWCSIATRITSLPKTNEAAFHPGHIVPGLDFTNDPLLQGRLFSYADTQIQSSWRAKFP
ncbi:catalase [Escherichia coli]|nr:catalase [Escherichia coli]